MAAGPKGFVGSNPALLASTSGSLLKEPRRAIISDEPQKSSDESDKGHGSRRHRPHHNGFHLGSGEVDGRPAAVRARRGLHGPLDRLPGCAVVDQGILGTATAWELAFRVALSGRDVRCVRGFGSRPPQRTHEKT